MNHSTTIVLFVLSYDGRVIREFVYRFINFDHNRGCDVNALDMPTLPELSGV